MFYWNEAGISLKLVSAVTSTAFSIFLHTYRDSFAILRLSDSRDSEAKPWDHDLSQTVSRMVKPWELEGLYAIIN